MMVKLETLQILTHKAEEFINITEDVHRVARNSEIKNGLLAVITAHTTTGIVVNEALPCVETDIMETFDGLVPSNSPYAHAHFLPSYGATGNNSTGHIKSTLTGNHCVFPLINGEIVCGGAQDIYLVEFDGPQLRRVFIEVIGE